MPKVIRNCAVKGCKSLITNKKQKCYECSDFYSDEHAAHLTLHTRCQKALLCKKSECWAEHVPWCETHLKHMGPLQVVKKLGKGSECVYLYYWKSEIQVAQQNQKSVWLCKIGRTKGEPTKRILGQGALTAHSEIPIVALALYTEDSHNLERMIHAALSIAGRHRKGLPGNEWFETNPVEVGRLYTSCERIRTSLSDQ